MLILSLGCRLLSTCCELGLFPRIGRKGGFLPVPTCFASPSNRNGCCGDGCAPLLHSGLGTVGRADSVQGCSWAAWAMYRQQPCRPLPCCFTPSLPTQICSFIIRRGRRKPQGPVGLWTHVQGAGVTEGVGSNGLVGMVPQTEGTGTSHPCLSLPSGRRGGSSQAIHLHRSLPPPPRIGGAPRGWDVRGGGEVTAALAPLPRPVPAAAPWGGLRPPAPAGRRPALRPG